MGKKRRKTSFSTYRKGDQPAKKQKTVPKAGEEGYKTPTQLRNERKRRAKKMKSSLSSSQAGAPAAVSSSFCHDDPSLAYLSNPQKAPVVQQAIAFFKQYHRLNLPIVLGPATGWRTVAKLAVRRSKPVTNVKRGELTIGLFQKKTHNVIPGETSPCHHPSINQAITLVQSAARRFQVEPFDETTGAGDLRYVSFHVNRQMWRVQVTLVWSPVEVDDKDAKREDGKASSGRTKERRRQDKRLKKLCQYLESCTETIKGSNSGTGTSSSPRLFQSLWVHYNTSSKHDNAIFARDGRWECRFGPLHVEEFLTKASKIPLYFSPRVFRQANLGAFSTIVIRVQTFLQGQLRRSKVRSTGSTEEKKLPSKNESRPRCLELYGGVGTIGLHITCLCQSLVCSDENPFNKECFEKSRTALLKSDQQGGCQQIEYRTQSATAMIQAGALDAADWVIVDPPRKGLDDEVLAALCREPSNLKNGPHVLVYVSCGFSAFQRDCQALVTDGGWNLDTAEGHILFPGSDAIETLAFFTRYN